MYQCGTERVLKQNSIVIHSSLGGKENETNKTKYAHTIKKDSIEKNKVKQFNLNEKQTKILFV